MFPKIINHIWLQGGLPKRYENNFQKWSNLHKSYEHNIWDESTLLNLCSSIQIEKYKNINTLINKVNFLKYILMYKIGGIYADLDSYPLKSIDELLNQNYIYDIDLNSKLSIRYPFNVEIPIRKFEDYNIILPTRPSLIYYSNGDKALLLDNPFLMSEPNNEFWINLIDFCEKRINIKHWFGNVLPHEPYGPYGLSDFLFTNFKNPFLSNILILPPIYWCELKTISTNQYIIHEANKGW